MTDCIIDGCARKATARRLCRRHYEKARLAGTLDQYSRVREAGRRPRIVDGYRVVWAPEHPLAQASGYVLEHRKVAWDALGPFNPEWEVHHRNEDKLDNRPENLEPMPHPVHSRRHTTHRRQAERSASGPTERPTGPDRVALATAERQERDDLIVRLSAERRSNREVAEIVGCTALTVSRVLTKRGVPRSLTRLDPTPSDSSTSRG